MSSPQKAKEKSFHFTRNKLGPIIPFQGIFSLEARTLHLNNWAAKLSFDMCNQLNQIDQMGLIKDHPFLFSSHTIYQCSQGVISFCTKTYSKTCCGSFRIKLFSLFFSKLFFSLLPHFNYVLSFSCTNFVTLPLVMIMEGYTINQFKDPI